MGNSMVNTFEALDADVKRFLDTYGIHRVLIGAGEVYQVVRTVKGSSIGQEVPLSLSKMDFWCDASALSLFDANGVMLCNRVSHWEDKCPKMCSALTGQGTESFVAVKVDMDGGQRLMILFEMVQQHRKWSASESGLLHIAAWIIARRYLRVVQKEGNS